MNKKIISGAFWLSFGSIVSRILGVVYLIPWLIMIGSAANQTSAQALFNSSYQIYAMFISLGTAGFPSAVARRVAMYNGEQKFLNSRKIARTGFAVMVLSGVLCGIVMYVIAPILAKSSPVVSATAATKSIRLLVPAIVILPSMSFIRGWFQGNEDMQPYGMSQLWEQLLRIIFILGSTYVIIYILHLNFVIAVYSSILGAFIGAIASYLYLGNWFRKKMPEYSQRYRQSKPLDLTSIRKMFMMIIYESVPFVFVGSGITLTQLIDQFFFKQVMQGFLHNSAVYTQYIYTLFSANPTKITTVVLSLALAVAETSLPLLSKARVSDQGNISKLISENLNLLLFVLLPVIAILGALSAEIYGIFFNFDELGGIYLLENLIQALIMGLAINGLTLLQSLRYSKKAVQYLLIGLAIKLVIQFPCVYYFEGFGGIIATAIAFLAVVILCYSKLHWTFNVRFAILDRTEFTNILFFLFTIAMYFGVRSFYVPSTKLTAFIYCAVFSIIQAVVYVWIGNKMGASRRIFGRDLSLAMVTHR